MQLKCRLLISLSVLLLHVEARHAKSSGLRGRGYPLDSPDATWLPVEDEVDESLADTKDEIETAEKELAYVKEYCNGKNHGRCKRQVERMSARLERLIAAEKSLRKKDESAKKVEDGVRNMSLTVVDQENQVDGLHAVKKFAELSKADFDNQYKRLTQASEEYQNKMDQAQSQINALKKDLTRARRLHYDAEQRSLDLIAKAKGIERGVETPDLFADAEFARAVRKQHVAEGLYARADSIREHAEKMMILHHDENKSEVKEVMYGTAHRLVTEDQGIVNFGHMSDFGGELPHENEKGKPCKKVKKVKEEEDDDDQEEENPNAPADEDNPNAPAAEPVEPAAEVVVDSPKEESNNINVNANDWKEVEMKDANTHKEQWVALPHHKRSKKTVTPAGKQRMVNRGQQKQSSEPKAPAVPAQKPIEIKKQPEAKKPTIDNDYSDDEPQPVEDDESGGADGDIGEADMPAVEVPTTTVTTTTTTIADSLDSLAAEDSSTDLDEDSPEVAEADVDDDTVNMNEAERQFKEAEEAERALG